jgi:hypothetical protein
MLLDQAAPLGRQGFPCISPSEDWLVVGRVAQHQMAPAHRLDLASGLGCAAGRS